jgi:hypothetical protein
MQIQQVVISNVLGLARADIVCTAPVVIVAGNNEAGKSTLSDAISMALLGTPRRVKLKKELGQLLHDDAAKGRVTIMAGGDVMGDFKLPGGAHICELEARHKAFVEFVLDPALFARQAEAERRSTLFKLTNCKASPDATATMLIKRGISEDLANEVKPMLRGGFPAAAKEAAETATKAKGAWRAVTGENWGSDKAEGWTVELPNVEAPTAKAIELADGQVETTKKSIADGQQFLGQLKERQRQAEGASQRTAQLREQAEGLGRAQAKLASTESDLIAWTAKAVELTAQVAAARNNAGGCECPSCGAKLKLEGGELKPYQPSADSGNLALLQVELKKATDARDLLQRTQRNDLALVAAAEQAQADLAAAETAQGEAADESKIVATVEALNGLQQRLASEQAKASALTELRDQIAGAGATTQKAAAYHKEVTEWLQVAEALGPNGIPAEILASAITPVNDALAVLARLAKWKPVVIGNDMEITCGGRLYGLMSESAKWRADCLIALAIAQISELRFAVLDRFDVLDIPVRLQLLGMLCELGRIKAMDTMFMCGTMKAIPAKLPPEAIGIWVSNGIAETDPQ